MLRSCRHCGASFNSGRGQRYCPGCYERLREHTCPQCGATFQAKTPATSRVYCSRECRSLAKRIQGLLRCEYEPCGKMFKPHGTQERHYCSEACRWAARGREPVRCRWSECPRPGDLIPGAKHRLYHDECLVAYRRTTPPKIAPAVVLRTSCRACGGEICYQRHGDRVPVYCATCLHSSDPNVRAWIKIGRPQTGEELACALEGCNVRVYRAGHRLRKHGRFFCSAAHRLEWHRRHTDLWVHNEARRKPRLQVRCVVCGGERVYPPRLLPRRVDRATMTWICWPCRQRQSRIPVKLKCPYCWLEAQRGEKTYAEAHFTRLPAYLRKSKASKHFCTSAHASKYYYRKKRKKIKCPVCSQMFTPLTDRQIYCSKKCDGPGRQGKPIANPRLDDARMRVQEAWNNGTRDIKALVRTADVARNTVRKLLRSEDFATEIVQICAVDLCTFQDIGDGGRAV